MTRAQKQSSFCLLQNRRPESQSPTFRKPADIGYNTLDLASKVRVPKRGVAPFGFPHHFRFSDTKPTLPVLHPCPGNHKEAPPPSSKGMLTVLLYIYPKVVFMQYCVSVSCGIVSLTKGTSGFPFAHSLPCNTKNTCQFFLRNSQIVTILFYIIS